MCGAVCACVCVGVSLFCVRVVVVCALVFAVVCSVVSSWLVVCLWFVCVVYVFFVVCVCGV